MRSRRICGRTVTDDMLLFSKRKELAKIYEKWIKENGVKDCAESVISFLHINELINSRKATEFINKRKNGEK